MRRAVLCLAVVLLALPVLAQSTRGRVQGRVADTSGLPLPGVTVMLTHEAGAALVSHTDEVGHFVFDVPHGRYTLTAELSGFETAVRPNLTAGPEPQTVDIVLEIGAFKMETQVIAQAPRIFTTAEPNAPATVDKEIIKMAPVQGMRYDSALPLLPGAVRGPDGLISISGARSWQGTVLVDHGRETDPLTGEPSFTLSISSIDTVQVYAPSPPAEVGPGTGGVTLVNTKAAADSINFNLFGVLPRPRFGEGVTAGFESWNPVVALSGPIVRERVWLAQSFEYRWERFQFETVGGKQDRSVRGWVSFTRLDIKPRGSHHISVRVGVYPEETRHFGLDAFSPSASVPDVSRGGGSASVVDRVALGNASTLETRLHLKRHTFRMEPDGSRPYVIGHKQVQGSYFKQVDRGAYRVEASSTWSRAFKGWHGDHLLKAGARTAYATLDGRMSYRPADYLRSDGTLARRIEFVGAEETAASSGEVGAFVQDTWTIGSGLKAEVGVRWDANTIVSGLAFLPRATLTYDLRPNSTKISGGAGVYVDKPVLQPAIFMQRQARRELVFDRTGAPAGPWRLFTHEVAGPLVNPRATILHLQVDQQLPAGWMVRASYQERFGRREFVVRPLPRSSTEGLLQLAANGESHARSAELTAGFRSAHGAHQVYVSYVRSMTSGNQNDLNTVVGNFETPLILPDERGPLAADVPHRFLSWAMISLPWSLTTSLFVEVRSGFPFTAIDEEWNAVGARNGSRFPLFVSLDFAVEKALTLPFGLPARLGLKFFNIAGRNNGRSIQRDVARPDFGRTYDPIRRQIRGTLEIAWNKG